MSNRKGKNIVKRRLEAIKRVNHGLTLEQAYEYFVNLKLAEGEGERTKSEYPILFEFFTELLNGKYPDITMVADITVGFL